MTLCAILSAGSFTFLHTCSAGGGVYVSHRFLILTLTYRYLLLDYCGSIKYCNHRSILFGIQRWHFDYYPWSVIIKDRSESSKWKLKKWDLRFDWLRKIHIPYRHTFFKIATYRYTSMYSPVRLIIAAIHFAFPKHCSLQISTSTQIPTHTHGGVIIILIIKIIHN